jgi:hypothetical protein
METKRTMPIQPRGKPKRPVIKPKADIQPIAPVRFPAAWSWFFDETVPAWVKSHYSPKDSWKNKPFSGEDARFFFKGVGELSEIFTEERSRSIPAYFNHPKFRSAYLLYFLPLQAAKFVTAFQLHAKALDAALSHGRKKGMLRVLDLGAGPGTASFALTLQLLQMASHTGEDLPPITFYWVDTNFTVMQEGKKLLEQLGNQFSKLRGKLTIEIFEGPWWKGASALKEPVSLTLMGHVLNESSGPKLPKDKKSSVAGEDAEDEEEDFREEDRSWARPWQEIFEKTEGGGILIIEPAAKINSQFISKLRNTLLDSGIVDKDPTSIWGPCPHAERCPLTEGRDWCHFSIPAVVPGIWFTEFSKALGSERQWLKFSYLWFTAQNPGSVRAPRIESDLKLVISDTLRDPRSGDMTVLLCEPQTPGRMAVPAISPIKRGDWIREK